MLLFISNGKTKPIIMDLVLMDKVKWYSKKLLKIVKIEILVVFQRKFRIIFLVIVVIYSLKMDKEILMMSMMNIDEIFLYLN